jgi:hypothetical protein
VSAAADSAMSVWTLLTIILLSLCIIVCQKSRFRATHRDRDSQEEIHAPESYPMMVQSVDPCYHEVNDSDMTYSIEDNRSYTVI